MSADEESRAVPVSEEPAEKSLFQKFIELPWRALQMVLIAAVCAAFACYYVLAVLGLLFKKKVSIKTNEDDEDVFRRDARGILVNSMSLSPPKEGPYYAALVIPAFAVSIICATVLSAVAVKYAYSRKSPNSVAPEDVSIIMDGEEAGLYGPNWRVMLPFIVLGALLVVPGIVVFPLFLVKVAAIRNSSADARYEEIIRRNVSEDKEYIGSLKQYIVDSPKVDPYNWPPNIINFGSLQAEASNVLIPTSSTRRSSQTMRKM